MYSDNGTNSNSLELITFKNVIGNKSITTNIYRVQACDLILS